LTVSPDNVHYGGVKTALATLVLGLAVAVAPSAHAAPADPPALICRVGTRLLIPAPCTELKVQGCPDGYRLLYPKTQSGPCVDERAK
jgi:hypothetical protein